MYKAMQHGEFKPSSKIESIRKSQRGIIVTLYPKEATNNSQKAKVE
jgi:hypothetical protein